MNKHWMRATLAVALLVAAPAAFGHGAKGPKGGLLADAGAYHQELLVSAGTLIVNLYTPDNQPVAVDGATATATVLAGGKSVQVSLAPAGGNSLTGKADIAADAKGKVVTVLTLPGKAPVQARYEIGHADDDGHDHGHDHGGDGHKH